MAKDDNTFSPWAWRAFDSGLNSGCHASMAIDNEGNVYGMIYTSDLTTTIYSVASDGSVRWTTLLRIPANKIGEESLSAQMALYMPH